MFWLAASTVVAGVMALAMIIVRLKAAKKPTNAKRIILPPLFMSTGAFMFLFPVFQITWLQFFEAITVGVICSVFLIKTSKFEIRDHAIYLIPSKAFTFILIGLLVFRIILKLLIGNTISFGETSGMFFVLAFGMIITWRISMLYKFLQLESKLGLKT
ncbi:CcdC family protein [Virgibacillus oceani]